MSAGAAEYAHWQAHGGIIDYSTRAKFRLTGADRVRYLNGQVTANVLKLPPDAALPACVTTAKGKLCAEVFISGTPDALYLDAEGETRESLHARLERYLVADEVTVEDVTATCGLLHFLGAEPAELLPPHRLPAGSLRRASRLGMPGWDLLLPRGDTAAVLAEALSAGEARQLSKEVVESIRLESGTPRWGLELGEETLPPEAGLERTHIDYAKGCYIGQEVISRLKSVGHVNRQLCGFISTTGTPIEASWSLFADDEGQQAVGRLTSAGWSFALAKPVALGYLKRGISGSAVFAGPARPTTPLLALSICSFPLSAPLSLHP